MTILVTGASGFIGAALCRALVAQGHRVRAFHRPTSSLQALSGLQVEHALGDVLDAASIAAAMPGVEAVFHTAGEMGSWRDPEAAARSHVLGTRGVLQAALAAGVRRVVYTSSVAALGAPDQPGPSAPLMDEGHVWNLRPEVWRYGYAKHCAEVEVGRAVAAGLDAVIVNPSAVFGPGDLYRARTSFVAHMARGGWVPRLPGGLNVVHIDDVVAGHCAALDRGHRGERYILGGENLPLDQFLAITARVVGRRLPRLALPAGLLRRLAGPVEALGHWLALPVSGDLLRLAGFYFFYDTHQARLDLGLPDPKPYRLAAEQALAWFHNVGAL